ncbi:sensor domain-containing protein [Rhodococcus coprophilus]|uniref:Lipoprotein n=1 Tax=Rhodococcus coprophilus TaxID=38310 RepID=A0A2X4TNK2_9NOCA|nr:sensor domain-containing protein [Rhodococcus coprophilus]MBM7461253.1 hypothetical protein [Rhodococcus coprophilus]SQI29127.1 lipoprotein [Rhodococcus coprophilus]
MAKSGAPRRKRIDGARPAPSTTRRPIAAAPLVATVLVLVAACTSSISGVALPEASAPYGGPPATAPTPVPGGGPLPAALLLPIDRFPVTYSAVVLSPQAVAQAAPDLEGIPPDARVDPAGCLPPSQDYGPAGTAMAVGTDTAGRATLSVEIVTFAEPLSEYRTFVEECGRVEATRRGATATVTTVLEPDPAIVVPGSETLGLSRTVRSGHGGDILVQSMSTRAAQLGSVRVLVTFMSFESDVPDTENLDRAYADAVRYAFEEQPR